MKKDEKNIAAHVENLVKPTVLSLGYDLWDVELIKEGSQKYLRITIDSENGVDIDDCEKVHRAVEPLIDEDDPIDSFYYLEISSPGLGRELKKDSHLEAWIGWGVDIRLYAPIDGVKELSGDLVSFTKDELTITADGNETTLPRKAIARISAIFDIDE